MAHDENPLVLGGIIGDVLYPFTSSVSLLVFINNREISNGCELRPSHLINRPRVSVGGEDLRTFYTLVLVDADAPSPSNPFLKEYLHCFRMVTDIPATTSAVFGKDNFYIYYVYLIKIFLFQNLMVNNVSA
ncbi:putative phosphatidylethanolamine-binding protein [Lupinus albus]|uniref:Putative phosphatidylethanolamine-binding protein n=1 Tax=Lupinus albus TaxID=3870 RepID=A0A6A4Q1W3_LUPAL|nr:putative phosphatidylethanolamine-binding protein [Lupinus albus]